MSRLSPFLPSRAASLVSLGLITLLGCGSLSDGDAPGSVVLDINGARSVDYVRGPLLITVQVAGASPDKVALVRNGVLETTLVPPFQYTWDTVDQAEGTYQLLARTEVDGKTHQSPVHTVVVDRTPPRVVGTEPSGYNVSVREGRLLRVTFSEPLLESSVPAGAFSQGAGAIPGVLSDDARTLTAEVDAGGAPSTRAAALNLKGLTDLAGNPLVQEGSSETLTWSWSLPRFWVTEPAAELRGSHLVKDGLSVALGNDGNPLAAYTALIVTDGRGPLEGERFVLKRWTGSGWTLFGEPLVAPLPSTQTTVRNPLLVMGRDGNPVVAFIQGLEGQARDSLHVFRWDGSTWKPMSDRLTPFEVTTVHGAALALDRDGQPVVAWSTLDGVHVVRWTSDRWAPVGDVQRATAVGQGSISAQPPALAVDGNNRIVLAWAESATTDAPDLYVRRWTGTAWESLGGKLDGRTEPDAGVRLPSLHIRADNQPEVLWREPPAPASGAATLDFSATWSGTAWTPSTLNSTFTSLDDGRSPAAALDRLGQPMRAWCDDRNGTGVTVSWYAYDLDTPTTEEVDSTSDCGRLSLMADAANRPVVAWKASVAWLNK